MKLNREQFLAAALALSATAGGCKLAKSDDVAAQASPESPQKAQPGTPAVAPATEGASLADPEANKARDLAGASERGTATGSGVQSKGLVKAPAAEASPAKGPSSPTKEVASPAQEIVAPAKEVVSPTKEVVAPTKEKLPAPTSEYAKKPPAPTKEL